jgi:hypothetical protein
VGGTADSFEEQQTATYLSTLLTKQPYHRKWKRYEPERQRTGRPHQAAVAKVIERHVDRESGVRRNVSLKSLPQRVSKALRGEALSRPTLDLFIDAFDISPDEAERLRRLLEGNDRIRVLRSDTESVSTEIATAFGIAEHRTKSVHEHHYVGPDGLPDWHRTQQVIESVTDRLVRYPYRFDTDALTVEVEQGGRLDGPVYRLTDTVFGVDIVLDEPLARGEQTSLSYRTVFRYSEPPPPEFRRGARGRLENVAIRVEFNPDRLPQEIWWTVWEGVDASPISREKASLRDGRYVFRQLDAIEQTVVGFTWEW